MAARQGYITLPPEFVAFEDSVASLAYQGRAIGVAVWPMIADRLEQSPAKTILTKVEKDNVTARRAFSKSGFHEIATVHLRRIGPCSRLTILAGNGATATWLAKQLAH
jgi:hypothetical protein